MNRMSLRKLCFIAMAIVLSVVFSAPAESQPINGGFLYTLSSFTGPVPYNFSRVTVDRPRDEIYILYQNTVRVFNDSGMEVYQFGDDLDLGQIVDLAVDDEGDILLLAYRESRGRIVRCNYRGEPRAEIELRGLPEDFSNFLPNRMVYYRKELFLASTLGMKVAIVDLQGNFKKGYDLIPLFDLDEKDRGSVELGGFSVDAEGNILTTVPVLFQVYVLSPDGKVRYFGKPGGAPGRFNIAAGIVRDSKGDYVVVDKLKAAVMVFDKQFNYVTIFGSRGYRSGELQFPDEIAIDRRDRVYVTQMGKRGVSVFQLTYN